MCKCFYNNVSVLNFFSHLPMALFGDRISSFVKTAIISCSNNAVIRVLADSDHSAKNVGLNFSMLLNAPRFSCLLMGTRSEMMQELVTCLRQVSRSKYFGAFQFDFDGLCRDHFQRCSRGQRTDPSFDVDGLANRAKVQEEEFRHRP